MASAGLDIDLNESTLKQLQCPVCLEYCTTPIYQCTNGHNICASCFPREKICRICQGPITSVRNLFAEQVSSRIKHPCKFVKQGCKGRFRLAELEQHLPACEFSYKCYMFVRANDKYVQCQWQGAYGHLMGHIQQEHKPWLVMGNKMVIRFFLRKFHPILIRSHEELFWCFFCNDYMSSSLQMYVFCIGGKRKVSKFTYEVTLASDNGECVIINKGKVQGFKNDVVMECKKDASGKNTIVSGKLMLQRFIMNNTFQCTVKIIKTE